MLKSIRLQRLLECQTILFEISDEGLEEAHETLKSMKEFYDELEEYRKERDNARTSQT